LDQGEGMTGSFGGGKGDQKGEIPISVPDSQSENKKKINTKV